MIKFLLLVIKNLLTVKFENKIFTYSFITRADVDNLMLSNFTIVFSFVLYIFPHNPLPATWVYRQVQ